MATPLEEALHLLNDAHPDEIRVVRLCDGSIHIEITPRRQATATQPAAEKQSAEAEELIEESLQGEINDDIRKRRQNLPVISAEERNRILDSLPESQAEEDSEHWVRIVTEARLNTDEVSFGG